MFNKILTLLALAGFLSVSRAETVSQNFAGNPLTNGWAISGDASLFTWDSINHNLHVTWDSTHPNSYFSHPLGTTVTRYDNFQIEFDLTLSDCISGNEPGKTGPLPVSIGLLNFASATNTSFGRGIYGSSPNVAEFEYFPYGYFVFGPETFPSPATATADFVSSDGYSVAPTIFDPYYEIEFPTNQPVHVALKYTAKNQTLDLTMATNGVVFYHPLLTVLNSSTNSQFVSTNDYQVDTLSISSFTAANDPYNSLLGHGTVDNLSVFIPPVQDFVGGFSNAIWQTQFRSRTNWSYTLERMVNFSSWTNISATVPGIGTNLFFQDTNPPVGSASYRVRATQP